MKIKYFFYAILIAFSAEIGFAASPRNEKELVQPDSWVYDSLTAIAIENGRVEWTIFNNYSAKFNS